MGRRHTEHYIETLLQQSIYADLKIMQIIGKNIEFVHTSSGPALPRPGKDPRLCPAHTKQLKQSEMTVLITIQHSV